MYLLHFPGDSPQISYLTLKLIQTIVRATICCIWPHLLFFYCIVFSNYLTELLNQQIFMSTQWSRYWNLMGKLKANIFLIYSPPFWLNLEDKHGPNNCTYKYKSVTTTGACVSLAPPKNILRQDWTWKRFIGKILTHENEGRPEEDWGSHEQMKQLCIRKGESMMFISLFCVAITKHLRLHNKEKKLGSCL